MKQSNAVRIDAHHHFWKTDRYDYKWMTPELSVLHRDFGPNDLQPLLARHRIDRTVLVQTISSVDETRWLPELADEHSFVAGVVGWVDLEDPRVGDTLDELLVSPGRVGIRHQVHDSQMLAPLVAPTDGAVYANRAYRNRPLRDAHKESNRQKPRIRARIEHVFGYLSQSMTEFYLRSVGRRRNAAASGLINRGDNRARYEQIECLKLRPRTAA